MLHAFVVTVWRVSRIVNTMFLVLVSTALLEVGWWVRSSYHKYLLLPAQLEFHLGTFSFTRIILRHLQYLLFWILICVHSGQIKVQYVLCAHAVLVVLFSHPLVIGLHRFGALPCRASLLLSGCLTFGENFGGLVCVFWIPVFPKGLQSFQMMFYFLLELW